MEKEEAKKLIPAFLEGDLDSDVREEVRKAIAEFQDLGEEVRRYEVSWETLKEWKDIEPAPGYVSRFWTEVSARHRWYETAWKNFSETFLTPRLLPAVITVCIMIIVGIAVTRYMDDVQVTEMVITNIGSEGIEFLENYELVENFEIIESLEFYEDYNVIVQWSGSES